MWELRVHCETWEKLSVVISDIIHSEFLFVDLDWVFSWTMLNNFFCDSWYSVLPYFTFFFPKIDYFSPFSCYVQGFDGSVNCVCALRIGAVNMEWRNSIIMTSANYEVEKFTGLNDFELWWLKDTRSFGSTRPSWSFGRWLQVWKIHD